jgi:hypothetical protein
LDDVERERAASRALLAAKAAEKAKAEAETNTGPLQ